MASVLTGALAFLFSLLVIMQRNAGAGIGILIMSMLVWPEYLRLPLGVAQMSVPRIIALILLVILVSKRKTILIKFNIVDYLVIYGWAWIVISTFLADANSAHLVQMVGRSLDTLLMYFIARLSFLGDKDISGLYWGLGLTALFMCIVGLYEAVTWGSPYHQLLPPSERQDRIYGYEQIRLGMLRAQASTQVSIYFGMAMLLVVGLLWSLRGYFHGRPAYKSFLLASVLAIFSSLSSGPWLTLIVLIALNLFYVRLHLIRPAIFVFILTVIFFEIASNRHFYNIVDYLALDKHTAWYRTRLIEVAISNYSEWILIGVGSNWPHYWAELIDGRLFIDVVNNFLIIALYGGIPALLMYLASHIFAIKYAARAFSESNDMKFRKMVFGLSATIIALDLSGLSVGLFGPALLLSHIILGCMVSAATDWTDWTSTSDRPDLSKTDCESSLLHGPDDRRSPV